MFCSLQEKVLACSHCLKFVGSVSLQLARRVVQFAEDEPSDDKGEDSSEEDLEPHVDALSKMIIKNFITEAIELPSIGDVCLPKQVPCRGGDDCREVYCR